MKIEEKGLSQKHVASLQEKWGLNILPEEKPPSQLSIFLSQLKSPLVYILLIAGVITLLLRHTADSVIIFLSLFLNTILGFIQERKANQAFAALNSFIIHKSEVIRDGERVKVDTSQIVPGDIVVLSQGTKVPADGELTFVNRIFFDEAIITGESVSVAKKAGETIFMGTTVQTGQALMRVTQTGKHTRIGHIAAEIQTLEEDTPLKQQLTKFSSKLVILILLLISFVFILGLLRGEDLTEIFATSVALAVSAIPEGLIISLTVVLAIGMQKILKRKGLVRKLSSAETLGGVTTICIDKTGTLTEGQMQVVEFVGKKNDLAHQVLLANDLDDPIVIAAYAWGEKNLETQLKEYEKIDNLPFSSKERFSVSLHRFSKDKNIIFVHGAPDVLLNYTTLKESDRKEVMKKIDELTASGKRVMGLARKVIEKNGDKLETKIAKHQLEWIGMLAFYDPVRPSVKKALQLAHTAGIKMIVITGDYAKTAQYVLSEIGLPVIDSDVLIGEDVLKLDVNQLADKVTTTRLFARTTPDQKFQIVEALQKNGEVVGMMGDGVNDAPAIHKADIGIVVNEASDVARESADLVLLNSNFSTVIGAIEEGRSIFENIRKIILYLLSSAFAEIFVVIGGIILGLPLPITAVQIIWINLVSDGLPNLALTVDPARNGIMKEPPRSTSENLVNKWMIELITIVTLCSGGIALLVFVITFNFTRSFEIARSMTFLTIGFNSLAYVFSVRSLLTPFQFKNLFENKWLGLTVVIGFALQIFPFLNEHTRQFFSVVPLDFHYWVIAFFLSILVFLTVESFKIIWNRFNY